MGRLTEERPESEAVPDAEERHVLVMNCGSSSLKFGFFRVGNDACTQLFSGALNDSGSPDARFTARDARANGFEIVDETPGTLVKTVERIRGLLSDFNLPAPQAIGHRVVHGGALLSQPTIIDEHVSALMAAAEGFASTHAPLSTAVIHWSHTLFPWVPQVACFDTAFHWNLPDVARTLPLPAPARQEGLRRYGFHGLSCESILSQMGPTLPARLVIAHLGNGASVTAVRNGRSVDTSMGLTPTGGMIMGSRSGDLDPGVVIHLIRHKGHDAALLETLLNERSGMLGISGLASDVRTLRAASATNADARLAIEMFCMGARKQIACMATALGGLDMLVFTGGIGEHDAMIREEICDGLQWMGIELDPGRNRAGRNPLQMAAARIIIQVLPSREEHTIARHVHEVCRGL